MLIDFELKFFSCFNFTVKVGGMRVVQHKPPSQKAVPTADLEDCTGLTVNSLNLILLLLPKAGGFFHTFWLNFLFDEISQQPPNINTELVSGAPVKGNADFSPEATQVAHTPKGPQEHVDRRTKHANHHINQPRKQ